MKVFHRHHFSSALKRMSVIAGYQPAGTTENEHIATVKGAPETLQHMVYIRPSCSMIYTPMNSANSALSVSVGVN